MNFTPIIKTLFFTTVFCNGVANAQTKKSYLLLNVAANPQNFNYYYPAMQTIVSARYVKEKTENTAYRFGVELASKNTLSYNFEYSQIADTIFLKTKSVNIIIPKIVIGKEWRKNIHKDVSLYIGTEAGVGALNTRMNTNQSKIYNNATTTTSLDSKTQAVATVSIKPFIGLRSTWRRFTLGWETGTPFHFTTIPKNFSGRLDYKLQHHVSLGYVLNVKD